MTDPCTPLCKVSLGGFHSLIMGTFLSWACVLHGSNNLNYFLSCGRKLQLHCTSTTDNCCYLHTTVKVTPCIVSPQSNKVSRQNLCLWELAKKDLSLYMRSGGVYSIRVETKYINWFIFHLHFTGLLIIIPAFANRHMQCWSLRYI